MDQYTTAIVALPLLWYPPSVVMSNQSANSRPADASTEAVDFAWYQSESARTWAEIDTDHPIVYPTLGLTNEAGELAGKVKKIFRDKQGRISDADREALKRELGDVLWYLTQICTQLDLSLADVAAANVEKVLSRQRRGKIGGDGEYR